MRKNEIATLVIILASFIIGIYYYPEMPERMASHWNVHGQVDGFISNFWGLFLMPFISLGMFLLFLAIPKIDPLKRNIEKFRSYFDNFVFLIILFLFYLYLLTLFWNLGFRFDMIQMLFPAFAILFFYAGILVKNAKRNWFIGIRTPWTMSSEEVWNKTHMLGGKLFMIAAIIILIGTFFKSYAFYFMIIPIIFAAIVPIVYSYTEYRKIRKIK